MAPSYVCSHTAPFSAATNLHFVGAFARFRAVPGQHIVPTAFSSKLVSSSSQRNLLLSLVPRQTCQSVDLGTKTYFFLDDLLEPLMLEPSSPSDTLLPRIRAASPSRVNAALL